ncbi:MAG: exo-alpha-sialidase [Chloroflexi bacterium]|nr:exo-alpha-sialidase [Chloroflexota bacterium]
MTNWLCEQQDLFVAGNGGYHTYRIPALVIAADGALLAICEGRRHGVGDAGEISLLLRRSVDAAHTWDPPRVIVEEAAMTCGNPCPVLDRVTGMIWLPFCKNRADGPEQAINRGEAPRTVWLTHSADHGRTWAPPVEITAAVKRPDWTWYATGPGHGIQLRSGRLIIPCDHRRGLHHNDSDPLHAHVVFSDNHGATWDIGGVVPAGTNECCVAETGAGEVYINCRDYRGTGVRSVAWSSNGGLTFGEHASDPALPEPVCQGSLAACDQPATPQAQRILFANPASARRECLTLRLSNDGCRTWPFARTLYPGPAAYSDLAVTADGTVLCLYERGDATPYERLTLARTSLAWLCEQSS